MIYLGTHAIDATSPDYAKKSWVSQQGYLTSDDVSNFATTVDISTFITVTAFQDWVSNDLNSTISGLDYITGDSVDTKLRDYVSNASLDDDVSTLGYLKSTNIKTINNQSILGEGNLTIDLAIYEVVQTLPSQDINANKIYLVPMSQGSTATNQFDEYVYANNTWEKIGTIEGGNVDLDDYLTIADASANFVSNASLDDSVSALNYVKSSTLNDYLLSSTASSTYATISSLDDYVTNASLDQEVSALGYLKSNDVSNLATKAEISGFKNIVQCTDAEYAALVQAGTVDANTVYLTYTASA